MPNQTPDGQLELIRKHLAAKDSATSKSQVCRVLAGAASVDTPIVRAAIGVFNKHGATPAVAPRLAGSAPYYVFRIV